VVKAEDVDEEEEVIEIGARARVMASQYSPTANKVHRRLNLHHNLEDRASLVVA